MLNNKTLLKRIVAVFLLVFGLILGVTWNSAKFCIGDNLFNALSLPAWSDGNKGLHYPALIGSCLILLGIALVNSTLDKKARVWLWAAVILLLIVLNLALSLI